MPGSSETSAPETAPSRGLDRPVADFAAEVGDTGAVTVVGHRSRGGGPVGDERVVVAPSGIVRVDAPEMIVECGAATPVEELQAALAAVGQTVALPSGGTVGGALAIGRSDLTRLAHGPMRDVLLQTHVVTADGQIVKAGGATVKNVSGFDLCRLLVGARGTLGFFGDVILRTRPLPPHSEWFRSGGDPFELLAALHRPVSILWDGTSTWVRLDGHPDDVAAAAERHGFTAVDGPPELPSVARWSVPPARLGELRATSEDGFVAEIGVGVVHHSRPQPGRTVDPAVRRLHDRLRDEFDPTRRLNPGVDPLDP